MEILLTLAAALRVALPGSLLLAAAALGVGLAVKPLHVPAARMAAAHAPVPRGPRRRGDLRRSHARELGRDRLLGPELVPRAAAGVGSRLPVGAASRSARSRSSSAPSDVARDVAAGRRGRCAPALRLAARAAQRGRPPLVRGRHGRAGRRRADRLVALPHVLRRAARARRAPPREALAVPGARCGCSGPDDSIRMRLAHVDGRVVPTATSVGSNSYVVLLGYLLVTAVVVRGDRAARAAAQARVAAPAGGC